jgi:hypothetical protein
LTFTQTIRGLRPLGCRWSGIQNRSRRFCRALISPGWTYSELPYDLPETAMPVREVDYIRYGQVDIQIGFSINMETGKGREK